MFYLIYVSSATKRLGENDLSIYLEQFREKNLRLGITGMLLYKGGNFMQMLEGEKNIVLELYAIIQNDERHKDVTTILTEDIKSRNFDNWSMGFLNMDAVGNYPKYSKYIQTKLNPEAFHEDSRDAYDFIVSFNDLIR